jgi:hypothetical protein
MMGGLGGLGGLAMLAALCLSAPARAEGQIYLCVSPNGQKELTDINKKGNCKLLDLPGAITSPPKKPALAASGASSGSAAQPRAASTSPADFPRVDNAAQKARDSDRRQILQDELKNEQQKLAELKKEFNDGQPERQGNERNYAKYLERVEQMKENLARMERNVDALKREIANIR